MRCYRTFEDLIFGAGVELRASTADSAIAEATEIAAIREWPEFAIWDGTRILFKMRAPSIHAEA
jgi:hypothetical protein